MGDLQAEPSAVATALNSDMSVDLADLLASVAPQKQENIVEHKLHVYLAFGCRNISVERVYHVTKFYNYTWIFIFAFLFMQCNQ